jgi:predicted membrane metal-binding protein
MTELFGSTDNLTNIGNFVSYVANATDVGFGPIIGIMILIVVPLVAFISMKPFFSYDRCFVAAGFFGFIISIFLLYLELINVGIFVIYILFFAITIWMVTKERGGEEA